MKLTKDISLSLLSSLGVGIVAGFIVAGFHGIITDMFDIYRLHTSFVLGMALSYGVLFFVASIAMLAIKTGDNIKVIYPLSGSAALLLSVGLRSAAASFSTLDCASNCEANIVPKSIQEAATRSVIYVLSAIFIVGVLVYIVKVSRSAEQL